MKCYCCQDGNLTNFACIECQNVICFKCINEVMKNNIDTKRIKICNTCITKHKYKSYINLETPELKRDLENGLLTKCEFCLNIWDGCAQCDCDERYECMNMQENKNYNNYKKYLPNLPNFSNFINFELYPKDKTIDVKSSISASEMV